MKKIILYLIMFIAITLIGKYETYGQSDEKCAEVLKSTKIHFASRNELAQLIYNKMETVNAGRESNSFGVAASVIVPTQAGPIPVGLSYDKSSSESYYQSVLDEFENQTHQTITVNQDFDFIPANQTAAWKSCMESKNNSILAMFFPSIVNSQNQLLLSAYVTPNFNDQKIDGLDVINFFYTDSTGKFINDSSVKYISSGTNLTHQFTINPKEDFYVRVIFKNFKTPLEFYLPKQSTAAIKKYKTEFSADNIYIGCVSYNNDFTYPITGFKPKTKVLLNAQFCLDKACDLQIGKGNLEDADVNSYMIAGGVQKSYHEHYKLIHGAQLPNCQFTFSSDAVMTDENGNIMLKIVNNGSTCHNTDQMCIMVNMKNIKVMTLKE